MCAFVCERGDREGSISNYDVARKAKESSAAGQSLLQGIGLAGPSSNTCIRLWLGVWLCCLGVKCKGKMAKRGRQNLQFRRERTRNVMLMMMGRHEIV